MRDPEVQGALWGCPSCPARPLGRGAVRVRVRLRQEKETRVRVPGSGCAEERELGNRHLGPYLLVE